MKQLECRFYSRQEISEITAVNPNDSKHFARNIKAVLDKWGYQYNYSQKGVEIIQQPETPEERLSELLIRAVGLDIQVNPYTFSCFLCAFTDVENFTSMPWEQREIALQRKYNVCVCDKTLRNWCSKLMKKGFIQKDGQRTAWVTEIVDEVKQRFPVDPDSQEMKDYFQRRHILLEENRKYAQESGLTGKEAINQAWSDTMKQLWKEFHCCYYYCKGFCLSAFDPDEENILEEIYELTREIAAEPGNYYPTQREPKTKEEFYDTWFN